MRKNNILKNRVLICGYYGQYNFGDEAMLAGMLKLLHNVQEDPLITVLSANPQDTQARHSVKTVQSGGKKFLIKTILAMLQNRYFILGGGDLLRDNIDRSVAKRWLNYLQLAMQLRLQTLVLGVSVGEIWRAETQKLIPQVLNKVNFLSVRDEDSKTKLEKLGVNKTIHVMTDLALQALPDTFSQPICSTTRPLQIGISVRPLKGRGLFAKQDTYPIFQQNLAAIADFLSERYGVKLHFLPFQTYECSYHSEDDYLSILELLEYSNFPKQYVVHRYFKSLQELTQLIGKLDLVIGMRLHSLILAAGLGKPVIAAEYDVKVRGFMHEIGQSKYSIPLDDFTPERVLPIIETILQDPFTARTSVEVGVKQYRQRMVGLETALSQLFTKN